MGGYFVFDRPRARRARGIYGSAHAAARTQHMPAADGGRECRQCREDARAQPRAATLCYKYLGHDPLDVTRELSTWFHASWAPTRECRGRLLDFPETFSVFDFLQWEYRVLPFDNQLHVTHWNLVHLSPFRCPGDDLSRVWLPAVRAPRAAPCNPAARDALAPRALQVPGRRPFPCLAACSARAACCPVQPRCT